MSSTPLMGGGPPPTSARATNGNSHAFYQPLSSASTHRTAKTARSNGSVRSGYAFTPMSTRSHRKVTQSFTFASSVLFLFLFLMYGLKSMESRVHSMVDCVTHRKPEPMLIAHDPYFLCPDGRRGLQVVQTRFMLGQTTTSNSFKASRLVLMNTFFVSALNAQTSKAFVVVVHHESRMNSSVIDAMKEVVSRLKVPVVFHEANRDGDYVQSNVHSVSYANVTRNLVKAGFLAENFEPFDIYMTSRLDMDDAVNKRAVEQYQQYACSVSEEETRIGKDCPQIMRLIYPITKLLWFPAANTFGDINGKWKAKWRLDRWIPTLSAMIIYGSEHIERSPIDIYSFNHAYPYTAYNLSTPEFCFSFNKSRHLHEWIPQGENEYAGLYTRTAGVSTSGVDKGSDNKSPADIKIFEQFGVDMGDLVATNALFYGLQEEAKDVLTGEAQQNF